MACKLTNLSDFTSDKNFVLLPGRTTASRKFGKPLQNKHRSHLSQGTGDRFFRKIKIYPVRPGPFRDCFIKKEICQSLENRYEYATCEDFLCPW